MRTILCLIEATYVALAILCIQLGLERHSRNQKQWKLREKTARVRWSYAVLSVQHNEEHNLGYTAGLMP